MCQGCMCREIALSARGACARRTFMQVTSVKAIAQAKGKLKASVRPIAGSPNCEVICCSYYDDKPFHMMGNTTEGVSVISFYRRCFSTATQKHFYVQVLRLSLADLYNFNMNQVDRADQLRHYYRPDGLWMRMRKWWWAVFLWALGQAVVNAYVAYLAVCKEEGAKPMSHLRFQVSVITTWCTQPKLVLEYKCVGDAAAPAPANQGVRGERDAAVREARERAEGSPAAAAETSPSGANATTTPRPRQPGDKQPRLRRKSPAASSTDAELEPGVNSGTPKMSDAKHARAIESYAATREDQHVVDFVPQDKKRPNCQMCGTGRGMRKPGERYQTAALFMCATCSVMVCGPGCWKLLHGYYKQGEEPEEKAEAFRGKGYAHQAEEEEMQEVEGRVVTDEEDEDE